MNPTTFFILFFFTLPCYLPDSFGCPRVPQSSKDTWRGCHSPSHSSTVDFCSKASPSAVCS